MYTNLANLQQTMLLQQRMFLQALCQQNSIVKNANQTNNGANNDAAKKHFIAPSLSQYRFVSGQQVNKFIFNSNYTGEKAFCQKTAKSTWLNILLFSISNTLLLLFRLTHTRFIRSQAKTEWNGKSRNERMAADISFVVR